MRKPGQTMAALQRQMFFYEEDKAGRRKGKRIGKPVAEKPFTGSFLLKTGANKVPHLCSAGDARAQWPYRAAAG